MTTPIRITEEGKLIIVVNGEQIDLMDEKYKDCHTKDGFNISSYNKLKEKENANI